MVLFDLFKCLGELVGAGGLFGVLDDAVLDFQFHQSGADSLRFVLISNDASDLDCKITQFSEINSIHMRILHALRILFR